MNSRALKCLLLIWAACVLHASAQEKTKSEDKPQVTLPPAEGAVPEFSSRKMTLAECVALALAQNTEIRQAKDEVRRKEGISVEVRSALLPKVYATGNFEYQSKSLNSLLVNGGAFGNAIVADDELNWNAGIRVSQLLFDGGAALSPDSGSPNFRESIHAPAAGHDRPGHPRCPAGGVHGFTQPIAD